MSCFSSSGKEEQEEIYPPMIAETSYAQHADPILGKYFKCWGVYSTKWYKISIVKDTKVITGNKKLVIPPSLQKDVVA